MRNLAERWGKLPAASPKTTRVYLFYASYSGYQVSQFRIIPGATPPQIELALSNAGKVETYGPKASIVVAPLKGLSINLHAAWLHAKYKEFLNGGGVGVDYSGHQLEYAPKFTSSATVDYERAMSDRIDGFGHVTVSHHSSQYSDSSNAAAFFQKGYTLVDARLRLGTPDGR
ncbi:TonB-dependent receptor domain-containing protein [Sphingomonas glacialis]|uniref:TonB-dependent receptor domain-containing protein n=1 Tax=Sphingomonas glacialis TaxID=658225 RepID=UPI0013875EC4|nr:TonB-dependent receptor [Sphingomonas glacialis]